MSAAATRPPATSSTSTSSPSASSPSAAAATTSNEAASGDGAGGSGASRRVTIGGSNHTITNTSTSTNSPSATTTTTSPRDPNDSTITTSNSSNGGAGETQQQKDVSEDADRRVKMENDVNQHHPSSTPGKSNVSGEHGGGGSASISSSSSQHHQHQQLGNVSSPGNSPSSAQLLQQHNQQQRALYQHLQATGSSGGGSHSSTASGMPYHPHHPHQPQQQHRLSSASSSSLKQPPPPPPPPLGPAAAAAFDMMRRGSLNSAAGFLDDSLFRRPSLGDDLFHRRDSMDSSTAALDAAILDLSRRRYSMAAASSAASTSSGGDPSHHGHHNHHPHEAITVRQQQLQQQQRELEQQQKELEIQRQQLIASMQERSYGGGGGSTSGSSSMHSHPHHQQHHHHLQQHRHSSLGAGSLGLGSVHSQTSLPSLPPLLQQQQHSQHRGSTNSSGTTTTTTSGSAAAANGGNGQWWICQVCNSKAFSSHDEAMQHEATCTGLVSLHQHHHPNLQSPQHHDFLLRSGGSGSGYPYSTTMDSYQHGAYRNNNNNTTNSPMENSARGVVSMGMDSSRGGGGSLGLDSTRGGGGGSSSRGLVSLLDASTNSSSSSTHHGHHHHHQPYAAERNTVSMGPFAMLNEPIPLAMLSDKDWLTPLHCFVRRHCVEVFTATDTDVATPSKGKRKPIQVGQIGIRCPHCHTLDGGKARERGSVYYPTTIASIYNATMNLLQRHLHNCPAVPDEIMRRYETLKADDARSGTSKRYWIESALSLGLVDTPSSGIRHSALRPPPLPSLTRQQESTNQSSNMRRNSNEFFSSKSNANDRIGGDGGGGGEGHGGSLLGGSLTNGSKAQSSHGAGSSVGMGSDDMGGNNAAPLVSPEDKPYATTFSHHLLCQMQPCVFTEADRLGKRKGLPPGFPGLACRHCFGGYGSGRFFPSSIKTLSDTSKTLNVLHNHMMRCRKCPADVKERLEQLRNTHDDERAKMKFGSQKAFFARIWERLHGKDAPGSLKRGRSSAGGGAGGGSNSGGRGGGYMTPQQHHMPPPPSSSSPGGMPPVYYSQHSGYQQQYHPHHSQQHHGMVGLETIASVSSPSNKRPKLDANV